MGNTIFFLLIIFVFFLVTERIMMGIFQSSNATKGENNFKCPMPSNFDYLHCGLSFISRVVALYWF